MEKFQGKFRVPSARWATWDYGRNAAYFVTVCVARREHAFGEIVGGALKFAVLGQIAADCWREIPAHFPFVLLDEFVVMPNHVHGILIIDKPETATVETPVVETPVVETPVVEMPVVETPVVEMPVVETPVVETPVVEMPVVEMPVVETPVVETPVVETQDLASLRRVAGNRFGPQSRNLASIVRGYKIGVTKYAGQHEIPFAWQARYHDRVIRDAGEHQRIRQYIRMNPEHWTDDLYYADISGAAQ